MNERIFQRTQRSIRSLAAIWAVVAALALTAAARPAQADLSDCANMPTDRGAVSGVLNDNAGVCSYKGIPYAKPPVGELRWRLPQEPEPWAETLQAADYGAECIQTPFPFQLGDQKPNEEGYLGQEDCLYLNVWHKSGGGAEAKKPVMVFIHGGGFVYGSGAWPLYDGTRLAGMEDVVLVTFNYRLGPFGFLAIEELRDGGKIGNYGLHDQVAALKWVKKNIASFGGDPENITIFGESAGATSVTTQLLIPDSRGLFNKAIVESEPGFYNKTLDRALEIGKASIEELGCAGAADVAACMRGKSGVEVLKGLNSDMTASEVEARFQFLPAVDGDLIPDTPFVMFRDGRYDRDVKLIVGFNRDEAAIFAMTTSIKTEEELDKSIRNDARRINKDFNLQVDIDEMKALYPPSEFKTLKDSYVALSTDVVFGCPTISFANSLSKNGSNVRLYHFGASPAEKSMLGDMGAFHGAELPFVFGNFSFLGMKLDSAKNKSLARKVISLWASFARDGEPQSEGIPEWPAYKTDDGAYLELTNESSIGHNLKPKRCGFFQDAYAKIYPQ